MNANTTEALRAGARNLLVECAGLSGGESLVIFHEDPELGWYDLAAPTAVADAARAMGLDVTMIRVNAPGRNEPLADAIEAAMRDHDQTIYFARLGDQDRFAPSRTKRPAVMSYVTDAAGLASEFGRFPHRAFLELKEVLNGILGAADTIRVTCPAGTELAGKVVADDEGPEDVSVKRFPMGVYKPLPMKGFAGRVALTRYLVPTGSRPYEPPVVPIEGTVFADVDGGTITGFEGAAEDVGRVRGHYAHVAGLFGIEPMVSHSWHSGMHPACAFAGQAADDPDRWGNTVFMNPRILHFHTCGAYAPGEICWMVIDPQVEVDGRVLWDRGRMDVGFAPALTDLADRWPGLADLLAEPVAEIGV